MEAPQSNLSGHDQNFKFVPCEILGILTFLEHYISEKCLIIAYKLSGKALLSSPS